MERKVFRCLIIYLWLIFSGCSFTGHYLRENDNASLQNDVLLDVPYIQQQQVGYCGPAAVAMVLNYWGKSSCDQESIARVVLADDSTGASLNALKQFARDIGFNAFIARGELSDIIGHLDKGRPVIA
ncbi:MAG: C39 family peptidase, partial [bacterium]|nr:C39 family peptidase [bacterium]